MPPISTRPAPLPSTPRPRIAVAAVLWGALAGLATMAVATPTSVAPGEIGAFVVASSGCPSFHWSGIDATTRPELVVYRADTADGEVPILQKSLPAGATSWAPSRNECFDTGTRYAWAVRGIGAEHSTKWSEPRLFEVAAAPSPEEELTRALEVIRRYRGEFAGPAEPSPGSSPPAPRAADQVAARPEGEATGGPLAAGVRALAGPAAFEAVQSDTTGVAFGVVGESKSIDGAGVYGVNLETGGSGQQGLAGFFDGRVQVHGTPAANAPVLEVQVENNLFGEAIRGINNSGTQRGALGLYGVGVFGYSSQPTFPALRATNTGGLAADINGDLDLSGDLVCTGCVTGDQVEDNTLTGDDVTNGTLSGADLGIRSDLYLVTQSYMVPGESCHEYSASCTNTLDTPIQGTCVEDDDFFDAALYFLGSYPQDWNNAFTQASFVCRVCNGSSFEQPFRVDLVCLSGT